MAPSHLDAAEERPRQAAAAALPLESHDDGAAPGSKVAVAWGLILVGAALRFLVFAQNRSLWLDESSLALNIVHRSFGGLFKPLDFDQGAPLGYLLLAKGACALLGNTEHALRLVALVASVISLPLFYLVARRFLSPVNAVAALALYCFCPTLVRYAAEVKQYASDATIALLLLWILIRIYDRPRTVGRLLPLGLIGAVAIWFSHPAVFILAAAFMVLVLTPSPAGEGVADGRPTRSSLAGLILIAVIWAVSFGVSYFVFLRGLAHNPVMRSYWAADYPPFRPSVNTVNWYFRTLLATFRNPAGVGMAGLAAAVALVGARRLFRLNRPAFLALVLPLAVTFVAAALHGYPFRGRLLLFTLPFVVLLIAAGLDAMRLAMAPLGTLCAVLLVLYTARGAAILLGTSHPDPEYPDLPRRAEVRPMTAYLAAHYQPGDAIFVYTDRPYLFYAEKFEKIARAPWALIRPTSYDFEGEDWEGRERALDQVRNHRRAWVLLSHVYSPEGDDQLAGETALIDMIGKRVDSATAPGVALYLYDTTREGQK